MIFDNRDTVFKLNKRRYILILVYLTTMSVIIFSGLFEDRLKIQLAVIVSILYIIYNIFSYLLNYSYFSYNDDKDKIMLRFASLRPFDDRKKAIDIRKKDFKGYIIKKSFINLREELIIKVSTKKGLANYPPISLTALSAKHKNMLISSLNQFI
jgi:hypothetical protein